jgi:hypothetical protein
MNARNWFGSTWRRKPPPVRAVRSQRGFALVEARQRPGHPERVEEARVRFEAEARAALREWLMV